MTFFSLFGKMWMFGWEPDFSRIGAGKEELCDWIAAVVSLILLEEFLGIIVQISNRLVVKIEELTVVTRTVKEGTTMTREGDLEVGTRQGKRNQAHD